MFGSDGGAGAAENPGGAASASEDRQQQTSVPFLGERKLTSRSVRIVSMQDSNATTTATGVDGCREPGTDRTTTAGNLSRCWCHSSPSPSFILPLLPFFISFFVLRKRLRSEDRRQPFSSSSQTPDARLSTTIGTPPNFLSLGVHLAPLRNLSWKTRSHFYIFPILVLPHPPPSLHTFLDFNAWLWSTGWHS
jgi:hypothetical protein